MADEVAHGALHVASAGLVAARQRREAGHPPVVAQVVGRRRARRRRGSAGGRAGSGISHGGGRWAVGGGRALPGFALDGTGGWARAADAAGGGPLLKSSRGRPALLLRHGGEEESRSIVPQANRPAGQQARQSRREPASTRESTRGKQGKGGAVWDGVESEKRVRAARCHAPEPSGPVRGAGEPVSRVRTFQRCAG